MIVSHTFGVITPARRQAVWETMQISLPADTLVSEAFDASGDLLVLFVLERQLPKQLEQFHNDRVAECLNADVLGPVYKWIHDDLGWDRTVNRALSGCTDVHYIFPVSRDVSIDYFTSIGMTTKVRQSSKGFFVEDYEILKDNNTLYTSSNS